MSRYYLLSLKSLCGAGLLLALGMQLTPPRSRADETELGVQHAECAIFGSERERSRAWAERRRRSAASRLTTDVVSLLPPASKSAARSAGVSAADAGSNLIDQHIYGTLKEAGVWPAGQSNDFEFLRRVSLDLTGRIPTAMGVHAFASDPAADKRARIVEELLATEEWADKWTMFFGDLYRNTSFTAQVNRFVEGRNAFRDFIRQSLADNKPYNRMVAEMIGASGTNSFEQGEINWLVGGRVTGGPIQDTFDQQAADVAETFLGIGHMNCIVCHSGRRKLDELSLWGKSASRDEAWQMASFFSRTQMVQVRPDPVERPNFYYWSLVENGPRTRTDYALNTTTGNRPPRCAAGTVPVGGRCVATGTVAPEYPFSGGKPESGEPYRIALAREVTSDFQFARATVNYIWAHFFNKGLVEPLNQFDPARLDPDNPPPSPWTLQPVNAYLLNDLAKFFVASGYDLKALMRLIVNSEAYQMSARYDGEWNPAWENLFARRLVRRLWAEEIHDAIALASNRIPTYQQRGQGPVRWAMQFPEPRGVPDGANGAVAQFLDAFGRGNREETERRSDGSILQALNLMNDPIVMNRIRAAGVDENASLLAKVLPEPNDTLVNLLYLSVLSRYPSEQERSAALATLDGTAGATRRQRAENVLWALFNKVDFIYNY
ncbi:MAG: DUF1549 domain-containing protein [Bryobacteraceae bacterium]